MKESVFVFADGPETEDSHPHPVEILLPQLKRIAKYVINHPGDFGIDPIRVTAEKVGSQVKSFSHRRIREAYIRTSHGRIVVILRLGSTLK